MLNRVLNRPTAIIAILILLLIIIFVLGYARPAHGAVLEDMDVSSVIKQFEGFASTPYRDSHGWTVGYGHQVNPGEHFKHVTVPQANTLLAKDIQRFEGCVDEVVTVELTRRQRIALISFAYNVGEGNFRKSSLLKYLNRGQYQKAQKELTKWVYSDGHILSALVNRRQREANLFGS